MLDGKEGGETEFPEFAKGTTFWSGIRSQEASHNDKASWLGDTEQEFSTTEPQ